ncbi:MAG: VanZ family protein [Lachnospiraceae bacterium]|jgi:VanZ family protein|nr:VanZ family protein [Lachnospiraceae bacterium]
MIRKRQKVATIVLVVLVVLLYIQIFLFSAMSADLSQRQSLAFTESIVGISERILAKDLPYNDSYEQIMQADGFIRKTAHFLEYALLAALMYGIALVWEKKGWRAVLLVFLLAVLLAAADEWHQTFVPGRGGSARDVVLDSAGALCGMAVLRLTRVRFVSRRGKARVSRKDKAACNN